MPIQPFFGPHAVWYVSYQSLSRSWHIDLDYGSYLLCNMEIGLRAGVTGQQGMLTPLRHLIPPLVFPVVCVSLILTGLFHYLIWVLICTSDFSIYLAGLIDYDCRLFHSPNLDTLNLTTGIWNGAHDGCDRSAGDAYSSRAPDPTSDLLVTRWCRKLMKSVRSVYAHSDLYFL
jgi:hypothetical protein